MRLLDICSVRFAVFMLQGGWENDETVEEAAAREAVEEAGVRGDIVVR
jgi:8-oxo-dGTP pyrophosphatase MutT (NUDIX family)